MATTVTLLVENTARGRNILAEHGLAWWIEIGGKRVLFDAGQGWVIAHNSDILGIPVWEPDAIVLSHGHYDHVGGLQQILHPSHACPICMHPAALAKKYSGTSPEDARCISLPFLHEHRLEQYCDRIKYATQPSEIVPGLFCTGEIPRVHEFEDTGGSFFLDLDLIQPDPIADDLALYFDTADGIVVILGCAHAGLLNTLAHIKSLTDRPIHTVMGGLHLLNASGERLSKTISALRESGIQELFPCHCTGDAAKQTLLQSLPQMTRHCHAGTRWEF